MVASTEGLTLRVADRGLIPVKRKTPLCVLVNRGWQTIQFNTLILIVHTPTDWQNWAYKFHQVFTVKQSQATLSRKDYGGESTNLFAQQ